MLFIHWVDLYWLVTPTPTFAREELPLGLIDLCCLLGVGCVFVAGLLQSAQGRSLVPLKDPRLAESLAFENF